MNFFRLRLINTLLFFLIGGLIGFIFKDRFFPQHGAQPQQRYQPEYTAGQDPAPAQEEAPQETVSEPEELEAAEPPRPGPKPRKNNSEPLPAPERGEPVVIETSVLPAEGAAEPSASAVIKGSQDDFFSSPADYVGKDLEMELQMITARRVTKGWRLNFVYSGPDKKIDYLYADDYDILGEKPDLKIGYVYRIRFHCSRGAADSGNTLTLLTPTGQKAAWATGLSAVE